MYSTAFVGSISMYLPYYLLTIDLGSLIANLYQDCVLINIS